MLALKVTVWKISAFYIYILNTKLENKYKKTGIHFKTHANSYK